MSGPVASWSIEDVAQFVRSRLLSTGELASEGAAAKEDAGPHAVAQRFREMEICGSALLLYARNRQDLVLDLGLSVGTATALWEAIRELANPEAREPLVSQRPPAALAPLSEGVPPSATARPPDVAPGNREDPATLLAKLEQIVPSASSAAAGEGSRAMELQLEQTIPSTAPLGAGGSRDREADELWGLKLSALKTRARAVGVAEQLLERADDSDAPKDSVVRLLLERVDYGLLPARSASVTVGGQGELREELRSLKMTALKKRARAEGIDQARLEEAEDADAPREAIIDQIVAAAGSADSAHRHQRLRDELTELKLSALKRLVDVRMRKWLRLMLLLLAGT
jgi:hypothetical protein